MAQSMGFSKRKSLKRNCHDLEDCDESLPISKRINSLHIEGQSTILSSQQLQNGNALAGFSANGAGPSTSALSEAGVQQHYVQSPVPHRLEQNNCSSSALRVPQVNGHDIPSSQEANCTYNGGSHFAALMGHHQGASSHRQPQSPHELLLNNNESCRLSQQRASGEELQGLGYHPYSPTHNSPGSNQSLCQTLGNSHNPFFPNGQLSAFQNVQNSERDGESMSFANQSPDMDFHVQQLPSGDYDPELGVSENPYYFNINQMLYEAHLSRVRRDSSFSGNS